MRIGRLEAGVISCRSEQCLEGENRMIACNQDADTARTVGIIGLGYVGLPLVMNFIVKGYSVTGIIPTSASWGRLKRVCSGCIRP
jgi:hypothetical protein